MKIITVKNAYVIPHMLDNCSNSESKLNKQKKNEWPYTNMHKQPLFFLCTSSYLH